MIYIYLLYKCVDQNTTFFQFLLDKSKELTEDKNTHRQSLAMRITMVGIDLTRLCPGTPESYPTYPESAV